MSPLHCLAAITVALIWGLNFVVIKVGLHDFPPLLFSALRFLVAAVPAILFVGRCGVSWRLLLFIGVVLGVVKFSLLFLGIHLGMGAGVASLVLQSQVFFTIILAALVYREKIGRWDAAGLLCGASGLLVIGSQSGNTSLPLHALLLVLAAALAWAVSNMAMRRLKGVSPFRFMVWVSAVPVVPLLILSALFEGPAAQQALTHLNWSGIGALAYVGLLSTLFGYAVWGKLLSLYPAATVTPFALLVPVFGLLGGWAFLGETLSVPIAAGLALVLFGLSLGVIRRTVGWLQARRGTPASL